MNKKIAIYPGVFDPLTVGHMWVINECLKLYDSVVVAVATNPEKDSLFSTKERVAMLQNACTELKRVEIVHFEKEFLVNFAKEKGVQCIVRSIRTESDYEYERVLNHINRDINPDITTVFLGTDSWKICSKRSIRELEKVSC